MIALTLLDIRTLTANLFVQEMFDKFHMTDAEITTLPRTASKVNVQKPIIPMMSWKHWEDRNTAFWSEIKPMAYDIKGKKLPVRFRITFLPREGLQTLIERNGIQIPLEQVGRVCLNIKYEANQLTCVTRCPTTHLSWTKRWTRCGMIM